jgi:hypothetical protein
LRLSAFRLRIFFFRSFRSSLPGIAVPRTASRSSPMPGNPCGSEARQALTTERLPARSPNGPPA